MTVGIANTKIRSLKSMAPSTTRLGHAFLDQANKPEMRKMTIGGNTWTRRRDVYHLVVTGSPWVRMFHDQVGSWKPRKAINLAVLVALGKMPPGARYDWFVAHYTKGGRKWVRKEQQA